MSDERRVATRHTLWIPVQVRAPVGDEGEEINMLAVSRNISWSGALMIGAAELEVGATVSLTLQVPGTEDRMLTGTIQRVEANEEDPDGMWKYQLAVAFDDEVQELEAAFEKLVSKQPR